MIKVELLFEPRHIWIGVHWTKVRFVNGVSIRSQSDIRSAIARAPIQWQVFVCLVPMLPFVITYAPSEDTDDDRAPPGGPGTNGNEAMA